MPSASRIDLTNQFLIAMPGMADQTFAGTVFVTTEGEMVYSLLGKRSESGTRSYQRVSTAS